MPAPLPTPRARFLPPQERRASYSPRNRIVLGLVDAVQVHEQRGQLLDVAEFDSGPASTARSDGIASASAIVRGAPSRRRRTPRRRPPTDGRRGAGRARSCSGTRRRRGSPAAGPVPVPLSARICPSVNSTGATMLTTNRPASEQRLCRRAQPLERHREQHVRVLTASASAPLMANPPSTRSSIPAPTFVSSSSHLRHSRSHLRIPLPPSSFPRLRHSREGGNLAPCCRPPVPSPLPPSRASPVLSPLPLGEG